MNIENQRTAFEAALGRGKTYTERDFEMFRLGLDRQGRGEPHGYFVQGEKTHIYVLGSNRPGFVYINGHDPVQSITALFAPQPAAPTPPADGRVSIPSNSGELESDQQDADKVAAPLWWVEKEGVPAAPTLDKGIADSLRAAGFTVRPMVFADAKLAVEQANVQPIYQVFRSDGTWEDVDGESFGNCEESGNEVRLVYATQPDPAMAGDEWLAEMRLFVAEYGRVVANRLATSQSRITAMETAMSHARKRVQPASVEDTKLLDWIDTAGGADIVCFVNEQWEVSSGDIYGTGESLRKAINAAMKQEHKP